MNRAATAFSLVSPGADSAAHVRDDDQNMVTVAKALLACHARGADGDTMRTMCERLFTVTERELLERERRMMASGDPDLAIHVRRHGDLLFVLSRQLRDSRRSAAPPSTTFIRFVGTMVERIRTSTETVD
jgi:hypothetical protein